MNLTNLTGAGPPATGGGLPPAPATDPVPSPADVERQGERVRTVAEAMDALGVDPYPAGAEEAPGPAGPGLHDVYAALMRIEGGLQRIEAKLDKLQR